MSLLVLYREERGYGGDWVCDSEYNAFEAPIGVDSDRAVLLGDLLEFVWGVPGLKEVFGEGGYSFFAEVGRELVFLSSTASVLPIADNNTLKLRLRTPGAPPVINHSSFLAASMQSRYAISCAPQSGSVKRPTQPSGDSRASASKPSAPSSSNAAPAPSNHHHYDRRNDSSAVPPSSSSTGTLNNVITEEAVAAISDAAEVAKEAAKSLFSFASSLGKTVLEAASNVSASAVSGARLSGNITLGRTRVSITRELSEGGFGIVYLAQDSQSGRSYALKQLICQDKEQLQEAKAELETLLILHGHPNIIELIDNGTISTGGGGGGNNPSSSNQKQFYFLFPLYPSGTAWDAIEHASAGIDPSSRQGPPWPFPEPRALRVGLCAARALAYMHDQKQLSHRDVKPHNILMSESSDDAHVLMDFGSVSPANVVISTRSDAMRVEDEASRKTSMAFRPPELMSVPFPPYTLDGRVDVWSLGCTLYCLAFGRSPFESAKDGVQRLGILNGRWSAPSDRRQRDCQFSAAYIALIEEMLQVDMTRRPFMADVVSKLESLL